jgi:predicted Zn finger-like uncharacterized protein
MLINCPNCGAEYEVAEGMIPPAGRHVQCSSCHTRWFVAGRARAMLTEEQVLHRLETWSPKPIPIAPEAEAPAAPEPEAEAEPDDADPVESADIEPAPEPAPEPTPAAAPVVPIRRAAPAKPGETPTVARPAVVTGPPAPVRQALRLEIPATAPVAPPPAPRSRFGVGLLLALVLAGLAFVAYLRQVELAAAVPAAAPALTAYGDLVDDLREDVDAELIRPLHDALGDG